MDPLVDALRRLKEFLEAHEIPLDQEHILNWLDQFARALDQPEIVTRYQELRAAIEA